MFEFVSPETIEDSLQFWQDGAAWYAGGSDLFPELKAGLAAPRRLVNLKRIAELRGIVEDESGLRIGAMATLSDIAGHPVVREHFRVLADACLASASPQIRNVATLG